MTKLILFLFLFPIYSCGQKEYTKVQTKTYSVSSEVQPFVDSFMVHLKATGRQWQIDSLEIYITQNLSTSDFYGFCNLQQIETTNDSETEVIITPIIYINEDKWRAPDFTVANKEQLVFHELGHCLLGLDHDSTLVSNQPISIMHPTHTEVSPFYINSYSDYIIELFNYPKGLSFSFKSKNYTSNLPGTEIYYLNYSPDAVDFLGESEGDANVEVN